MKFYEATSEIAAPPQAIWREFIPGFARAVPRRKRRVMEELSHLAYGAMGGAAYAALPEGVRRRPWSGPAYGLVLWLGFETALAPVLRLEHAGSGRVTDRVALAAEPDNRFVWSPVYSRASGDLPLAELPKATVWKDTDPLTVVRFQLDATAGGAVKLRFNAADGLTLYAGANPVEVKPETVFDVKPGLQTLTLVIDRTKRTADQSRVDAASGAGTRPL